MNVLVLMWFLRRQFQFRKWVFVIFLDCNLSFCGLKFYIDNSLFSESNWALVKIFNGTFWCCSTSSSNLDKGLWCPNEEPIFPYIYLKITCVNLRQRNSKIRAKASVLARKCVSNKKSEIRKNTIENLFSIWKHSRSSSRSLLLTFKS